MKNKMNKTNRFNSEKIENEEKNAFSQFFHSCGIYIQKNYAFLILFFVGLFAVSAINFMKITGVVAVGIRLKHRGKINGVDAELFKMLRPVQNLQNAVLLHAVVFKGRAAEAQGVNLIKYAFICPHKKSPFFSRLLYEN